MLRVTIQYGVLEMLLRIFKAFFEILYVTFMYRCIQIFGVEICGKEPLGRPRRRLDDDIKMDFQEMGWGVNWIDLAQDRDRWQALVNEVMHLRVP